MSRRRARVVIAIAFAAAAFLLLLWSSELTNDHFDRISRGRQIARYGDLPFRDFFDPGYFLTEFTSAGIQRVLGETPLGDILLAAFCQAIGAALVLWLAWDATQSVVVALLAAALSVLTLPRSYDYDKVLFYPLGIALCWRYVRRRDARSILWLAAGLVVSALFRYDSGVYIAVAALVAIAVVHIGDLRTLTRRLALLLAASACLASPFLLFVQRNGGVAEAIDQIATYARREGARTRISRPPPISFDTLVTVADPPPPRSNDVRIRWSAVVDDLSRAEAEWLYGLRRGSVIGESVDRTWSYVMTDATVRNIKLLLADPRVDDTGGIDRSRAALVEEPLWTRVNRRLPFVRIRFSHRAEDGAAYIYYFLMLLPIASALVMGGAYASTLTILGGADRSSRWCDRFECARILSVIAMCVLLDVFILRDPIYARVGGMAGPAAILAAWTAVRTWRLGPLYVRFVTRGAVVLLLGATAWSMSSAPSWWSRVVEHASPSAVAATFDIRASRNSLRLLPNESLRGMVTYIRECTRPNDRVLATWFAPDLYFFAQRGFAGGMPVMFGDHWTEPRFRRRSLGLLDSQSVPIVLVPTGDSEEMLLGPEYAWLERYLRTHYRVAGRSDFGSGAREDTYTVLVRVDRAPTGIDPQWSMPCFA